MKKKIEQCLSKQLPFIIYKKPNETVRYALFQKNDDLKTTNVLKEACFVFAPFDSEEKVVFYLDECELIKDDSVVEVRFDSDEIDLENPKVDKNSHLSLVQKGIEAIKQGLMEKVVLSRKEEVALDESDYLLYYERFLKKYPSAFVYWFYHPKVGMWMGATPEQLVQMNDNIINTVALAATQIDKGLKLTKVVWGDKEKDEQQIVTDFIRAAISPYVVQMKQTTPYTHRAGTLLHIKTDIEAVLKTASDAYAVVEALHPTPALCGYPKENAKAFIIKNEGYEREFYGGFLGEWNFNNLDYLPKSDLFVNLRCMKIEGNKGFLYLGGGVNKDSVPENEYFETVNKSKTVKSIL